MSEAILEEPSSEAAGEAAHASVWRWIAQGARSAAFLRPDWTGLRGTPALLALVCVADLGVSIVVGRLYIDGPATFYWRSLAYGWLPVVLMAWGCWLALRGPLQPADASRRAVDAPSLLTMLFVQGLVLGAVLSVVNVLVSRRVGGLRWPTGPLENVPAFVQIGWMLSAQLRLAWVSTRAAGTRRRAGFVALLIATVAITYHFPFGYWQAGKPAGVAASKAAASAKAESAAASDADAEAETDEEAGPDLPMLKLSQALFEDQQRLFARQLDALQPQRPGVVDMYAITFAPYADVDVFMRESAVVAGVMESRFDTRGRTLQLVNNVATTDRLPWATPLNLRRAIERMARRMDRDEDILFIHLTSHGGADGRLAAEFFPLTEEELTPGLLRRWLDDAHIRNRVISISACFSGSWIAPLASDDTLVMTAADADHTSYGCGSRSTLTFFGQAMYDEQLRHTWSFEQAHAASRKLIEQREHEAGKTDGYSNPQISVGRHVRERLEAMEARLAASAAR